MNGADCFEPNEFAPAKNSTLVTEPELTAALAVIDTFAGAANTAPLVGVVMFTVGVGGGATLAGVVRVYANGPPPCGQARWRRLGAPPRRSAFRTLH